MWKEFAWYHYNLFLQNPYHPLQNFIVFSNLFVSFLFTQLRSPQIVEDKLDSYCIQYFEIQTPLSMQKNGFHFCLFVAEIYRFTRYPGDNSSLLVLTNMKSICEKYFPGIHNCGHHTS